MRILRVWWSLYSMGDETAKKGIWGASKEYTKKPMQSDFPESTTPEQAREELGLEHGFRPTGTGLLVGHKFAFIQGWKYIDLQEKEKPQELTVTQEELL